ncbi:MAG: hypothetical protein HUU55_19855 [Myxococcales bacterium]|nr:hypothetical protein [Myxococcales bacterium]
MQLNHVANRIVAGHLELVVEFFKSQLGFRVMRRTADDVWLRQGEATVDLQFSESATAPMTGDKHNSHVSFLSQDPEQDLNRHARWFRSRGQNAVVGSWSDREFYLDVPDVFVDFAIEAMRPELADYSNTAD